MGLAGIHNMIGNAANANSPGGSQNPTGPVSPEQARAERERDLTRGYSRGRELFVDHPYMQEILGRRRDMAQGVDSKEYQGLRDDMVSGLQSAQKGYMRQLLSSQGMNNTGAARSVGQMGELAGQFSQNRAEAEKKLMLDNIALKRQGVSDLEKFLLQQRFGELSSGLGEAQLGVADRTGYQQALIGQQMASAAQQQSQPGIVGQIFGGLL